MHELSIASAVLEIVERYAGERRVGRVDLKVGHLRQVVPSALEFAFELVAEGSVAEGAELHMQEIPAVVTCRDCGCESELRAFPPHCPACMALDVEVTGGDELLVESLELEEEALLTRSGG
jgi:hydrogenase nickel incorporation protein HypA/HybF